VIGREPTSTGAAFAAPIMRTATRFAGAFAVAIARGRHQADAGAAPLSVLVPVTGTRVSRHGAELAIAVAQAARASVTALHVTAAPRRILPWRQRVDHVLAPHNVAAAAVCEVVELGEHYQVPVSGKVRAVSDAPQAILREVHAGRHDLLIMGVSPRSGEELFFGDVAAEILKRAECSILFVSSEPAAESPPDD
jgi:nucleotide-binding universal stress UspA family protein